MENQHYLVIDTETGGLDKYKHSLIEIGAIVYDSSMKEIDRFHSMWDIKDDPTKLQTLYALKLNKYFERENQVIDTGEEAAEKFVKWLVSISEKYNPIIAGQNISFDIGFIDEFLAEFGYEEWTGIFGNNKIDTLMLGKVLQITGKIKTKRLSLKYLAEEFKVKNVDEHTALSDIETTAEILKAMLDLVKK